MTAMVSFLSAWRAFAIGNSFRVTTSSLVPPKSIIAIMFYSFVNQRALILIQVCGQSNAKAAQETRNPKAEIRKKAEARSPTFMTDVLCKQLPVTTCRPSDFGFLSAFGFRPSDFLFPRQRDFAGAGQFDHAEGLHQVEEL